MANKKDIEYKPGKYHCVSASGVFYKGKCYDYKNQVLTLSKAISLKDEPILGNFGLVNPNEKQPNTPFSKEFDQMVPQSGEHTTKRLFDENPAFAGQGKSGEAKESKKVETGISLPPGNPVK